MKKFVSFTEKLCEISTLESVEKCLFRDLKVESRVSWFEARNYCHLHKGDLFFLRSGENWKAVMEYMDKHWKSKGEEEDIFVGLQIQTWIWDGNY